MILFHYYYSAVMGYLGAVYPLVACQSVTQNEEHRDPETREQFTIIEASDLLAALSFY